MRDEKTNSLMTDFSFSEAEQETILCKMYDLLKKQANKYNGTDSTSMPIEKAQDLLESLLYTIEVAMENGATKEDLLNGNLSLLIEKGQTILKEKLTTIKVEWKLMCQDLPQIQNVYYLSTIKNLGLFFQKYDIYYEAHHIPCSIDYWPLCPISEKRRGISYIEEYLHRLQLENDFLHCFETNDIICLYKKYVQDYTEFLFNLCEPVLTNAIGLAMIGQDFHKLNVSSAHRIALYHMLTDKTANEMQLIIEQSVLLICQNIGLTDKSEKDYFINAVSGLSFRIYEALKHQDLSHIFLSFETDIPVNER